MPPLLQAHCVAIAMKRPDGAALLNAFELEPWRSLVTLLQHLPIDDGHAVRRIAGVGRPRHCQRRQLFPHRRRQVALRKHRAIGRRGPRRGCCRRGSRWSHRCGGLRAGGGSGRRQGSFANTRLGRRGRSGRLFTHGLGHALGCHGAWLQRDRGGREKWAGAGIGHRHRRRCRCESHGDCGRSGHGHRGHGGRRRNRHGRDSRWRAALHGPPRAPRRKACHGHHGAPPQQPVARAGGISTRGRHGLRMETGHSAPASLGFCAPQCIKDVGHKNQAPLRKRGSLTPVARLSSMRVRGPARPSGVTPWAS